MGGQGAKAKGIGWSETIAPTLKSVMSGSNTVPNVVYGIEGNTIDRCSSKNGKGWCEDVSPTLNTQDKHAVTYAPSANFCGSDEKSDCSATLSTKYHFGSGGDGAIVVYDARGNGDGKTVCTITGDHCNRVTDYTPLVTGCVSMKSIARNGVPLTEQANPICSSDYKDPDIVCYPAQGQSKYVVRRLTPLECSRLQGLKDDWCAIPEQESVADEDIAFWKPFWDEWMQINRKQPKTENQIRKWLMSEVSESAQYQMYGNGIAVPQWFWVCGRVIETYGLHKPTMASLFDGTGSFPWIWNSILGGDYTVWSSEVNPEAVRVSKYRIG